MTKTNTRELGFEEFIQNELVERHSYIARLASQYDKSLCLDTELVLQFVKSSQPKSWDKLVEQYGADTDSMFLKRLDSEVSSNPRGLLGVLRDGIIDRGIRFNLVYYKPGSKLNESAWDLYQQNILSVTRQVKYSAKNENSLDMVIFLNGLPVITIELKNQLTGQTVKDAIWQYKTDRDPKERLLSFKRCLTHFAVDTEQAYMTTKLEGLGTRFLPFNQGDGNASGNPVVPGKYKTHYLWESIWGRDSLIDIIKNFVHLHVEVKEDAKGRRVKKETLLFPRYHQFDTVRRLVAHAGENRSGHNYLIQHSAGSGKSNTIAWAAHRLSELFDTKQKKIFDAVVIITDRRILDRQLSEIVESFSQVRGVVAHAETGKELQEALEKGVKIIVTTLWRFTVIVDAIEATDGKTFAVLIDEAHSSQSGESAADLRQVLTLDEAEKLALKEEKAFKTTEDLLIERMKARKVSTPNISYLAFTATPKQKTLELFGTEDPTTGKFFPFSLYSMRQAIEEGFILDVLKNYVTYQQYFELLKHVEDDPEYDKQKAQRLLLGYVEKHEHAIKTKTGVMVEHFETKIAHLINGHAKAMIVTKSRKHAVLYKLAFDKYLEQKGYPHKALVAFSGRVKEGKIEYRESQMNGGISESQTAEEFKKDQYRYLIVAEKFQTGFDQPMLSVMYVDKKLAGVNAVQTLSRLNRIAPWKEGTFVLDFVNSSDDIAEAFQPYYTTTLLSKGTDPNILHDLERGVRQFKLFDDHEMHDLAERYFAGAKPDSLNSTLDIVVERYSKLLKNEQEDFKTQSRDFVKKYGFISQIITFQDTGLEELFIFLKFLIRKLPHSKDVLPVEILEAVNMDSYKVNKIQETSIKLDAQDGEIKPITSGKPGYTVQEQMDPLSKIIKEINDRFGTSFGTEDKVILNTLSKKLLDNSTLTGSIKHNARDAAKIKFDTIFQDELVGMLNSHFDLYKKLSDNPELNQYVNERIFDYISKKLVNR